jgi:hypothetical protein
MRKLIILQVISIFSCGANAGDDWDFAMPHKNRCSEGGQQQIVWMKESEESCCRFHIPSTARYCYRMTQFA